MCSYMTLLCDIILIDYWFVCLICIHIREEWYHHCKRTMIQATANLLPKPYFIIRYGKQMWCAKLHSNQWLMPFNSQYKNITDIIPHIQRLCYQLFLVVSLWWRCQQTTPNQKLNRTHVGCDNSSNVFCKYNMSCYCYIVHILGVGGGGGGISKYKLGTISKLSLFLSDDIIDTSHILWLSIASTYLCGYQHNVYFIIHRPILPLYKHKCIFDNLQNDVTQISLDRNNFETNIDISSCVLAWNLRVLLHADNNIRAIPDTNPNFHKKRFSITNHMF